MYNNELRREATYSIYKRLQVVPIHQWNRDRLSYFCSLVDRSGGNANCWIWLGRVNAAGYGVFPSPITGKRTTQNAIASRLAYELAYGASPGSLDVLHSCDNRCCVNPLHLRIGTQEDNMRDATERGRTNQPRPTKRNITNIRAMLDAGVFPENIAVELGLPMHTVQRISARYITNRELIAHLTQQEAH